MPNPPPDSPDATIPPTPDLATGLQVIRTTASKLDSRPGVYRMLAADGSVLYVGKARELKKRVASYVRVPSLSQRLLRMVAETRDMEIITTRTEVAALLLESNLIKTLKPRYNILLRDDKSYPYIVISHDHPWPRLAKQRGKRQPNSYWFGPFASVSAVNRTITELTRAFMLRNCTDSMFASRSRPCLQYQIKRCTAPCVGKVSEAAYAEQTRHAVRFLSGSSQAIQKEFANRMEEAAKRLEYEEAGLWRNRIKALAQIQAHQDINLPGELNADIIALSHAPSHTPNHAKTDSHSCIQVFFMRNGSNYGNRSYFPRHHAEAKPAAIMAAFIGQFYDDKPPPPELLVSVMPESASLIARALSDKAERQVRITTPQRGQRQALLDMANRNASESLSRHVATNKAHRSMLGEVQALFGLTTPITRIEVYDNSHIQGRHAVGAMIVAGETGFMRSFYRTYTIGKDKLAETHKGKSSPPIKSLGGDDYAMLREVLTRRFSRAIRDDPMRHTGLWPDLVIIDGGKGQLSVASETLAALGINDLALVAMAKGVNRNAGREVFHQPNKPPLVLSANTPVLHFLQRLRDEAHRFAIGAHRAKRKRATSQNPLDAIAGIGAKRKRLLLMQFGSARGVANADVPDLLKVEGISKQTAKRIYDWFHSDG